MNDVAVAAKDNSMIGVSPDQKALIKRTVAKEATDDELQLYFFDCQRRGVHPLDKKIHFTKRGGKYVPIVGIDFLREQAAKTGQCVGISDPAFAGDTMKPSFSATVTVKRAVNGMIAEFTATARWDEYCPASGQDHMWRKMPHTMLGKCAEALALRKGFPGDETGSLYIREELDQATEPTMNLGAAMVQDFPPDTALIGILKELIPAQGARAGTAKIQLPDGLMSFDMLDSGDQYKPLLNCRVEFIYGKNGKLRPITEMVLAPTVVQAPLKAVAGPVRTAPTPKVEVLQPEATTEPYASVNDDGSEEPPKEAHFETGQDCVGLVINVDPKKSRDGSKTWHVLTIACVNCDIQAKVWGAPSHFGFDSFEELLDRQVWFKVWSKEFRGDMEHTIDMLELYNQSPATK